MNTTYKNRIENGLCVWCGNKNDRTTQLCSVCSKKKSDLDKERKDKLRMLGLCPKCGERLWGSEKTCIECRAKDSNYSLIRYERDPKTAIRNSSESRRKMQAERKAKKICITCGKNRVADTDRFTCYSCRYKRRLKRDEYKPIFRAERINKGLCYICGEKAKDGYKVCENHHEMYINNVSKSKKFRDNVNNQKKNMYMKMYGG